MSARAWNRRRAAKRYRRLVEAADAFPWTDIGVLVEPWQSWIAFDEAWQMEEADLKDRLSAGRQRWWSALDQLFGEGTELKVTWPRATVEPITVEDIKEAMERLRREPALTIEFDLDAVTPEALALLRGDPSATIGDDEGGRPSS